MTSNTTMNQPRASRRIPHRNFDFIINSFSGGIAGVVAKTTTAPIERVKLILQTQVTNDKVTKPYKGIGDCFNRIIAEEGFWHLWRGNLANIIRYFPTQALNFGFKELYKDLLPVQKQGASRNYNFIMTNLLAGGLAGSTSTLFVFPLDLARTRLGVDMAGPTSQRHFNGVLDCIKKIYSSDGFRGIYRGVGTAVVGLFLYRSLYFGIYDSGKDLILERNNCSLFEKFLFAQFCVIVSESISYPTDTVKRRLMLQSAKKEVQYKGAFDCIAKIYKNEGITGFWRGNLSNFLRSGGGSLCLVLYDEMQKLMNHSNH